MEENQESFNQQKSASPLIFIGLVVVIAVIAGAFWLTGNSAKNNQPVQPTQVQTTVTEIPTEIVAQPIAVEGGNFYFKPNEIKVKKGEKVTITLTNVSSMKHDFVLDEFNVKSEQVDGGKAISVEFTPDKTGTFEFYCSVGKHRQMGMKGNLIVE